MFRWILRVSPLAVALPLLWALPSAALDIGPPCANGEGNGCEVAGAPPALDVHPGEGKDTVTFENGHDARPSDSLLSSQEPDSPSLETPSGPPSGDGEMSGGTDHPILREPGDPLPVEESRDAIGDSLGDPGPGARPAVPEPSGLFLLAVSAGGLLLARRRA